MNITEKGRKYCDLVRFRSSNIRTVRKRYQ